MHKIKNILEKVSYILSRKEKKQLTWITVAAIVGAVLELMGVTIFMPFINVIMHPKQSINGNIYLKWIYENFSFQSYRTFLIAMAVAIIAVYVVKNAFLIWQKKITYDYSFRIQKNLATKLLDAYMHEPYSFYLQKNTAELQRCLEGDVANFSGFIMQLLEMATELFVCIMLAVYLLTVSKTICIVIAGLMLICVLAFAKMTKKASMGLGKDCQTYKGKIYQWINQALGGIKEVKILGREEYFVDSFTNYYDKYSNALCVLRLISMIPKYIVEAVCMSGLLLAIIFKLLWGEADMIYYVPQLTVFAVAAFRLMPSVGRINGYLTQIISTVPSVNLVYHDLNEVDHYKELHENEEVFDWKFSGDIKVENVSFRYPASDSNVISNASFIIPRGKMIAFIGASGAGKTTMVDIILGLLQPSEGHVLADGMDIHTNQVKWHREIGYIPQTIYLADESIRENIAFGVRSEEIDDDAVMRAIDQAQLGEFIRGLPDGLDSYVGDRGVRISGGQRQRIGIARALYHNPEILVLDEATSALDTQTETAVMEAIDRLQGIKTMIIIAHRLTTIRNADMIYEVTDGTVTERTKEEVFGGK
jgi:ABC-type multidrug transport system fused ATPase/permease subunit